MLAKADIPLQLGGALKYEINISSPDEARTSLCHCKNCKVRWPFFVRDCVFVHPTLSPVLFLFP